jgi:hypothetical protein
MKEMIEKASVQPDDDTVQPDACPLMHLAGMLLENQLHNADRKSYLSHLTECRACRAMLAAESASRRVSVLEKIRTEFQKHFGALFFPEPEQMLFQPLALRGESMREYSEEVYTLRSGRQITVRKTTDETEKTTVQIQSSEPMRRIEVYTLNNKACFRESNTLSSEFELFEDCIAVIDGNDGVIITL